MTMMTTTMMIMEVTHVSNGGARDAPFDPVPLEEVPED